MKRRTGNDPTSSSPIPLLLLAQYEPTFNQAASTGFPTGFAGGLQASVDWASTSAQLCLVRTICKEWPRIYKLGQNDGCSEQPRPLLLS
jgi:hypothetical protein